MWKILKKVGKFEEKKGGKFEQKSENFKKLKILKKFLKF